MYVYMYTVFTYTGRYVYIYIYVCICVYIYVYVCIHIYRDITLYHYLVPLGKSPCLGAGTEFRQAATEAEFGDFWTGSAGFIGLRERF